MAAVIFCAVLAMLVLVNVGLAENDITSHKCTPLQASITRGIRSYYVQYASTYDLKNFKKPCLVIEESSKMSPEKFRNLKAFTADRKLNTYAMQNVSVAYVRLGAVMVNCTALPKDNIVKTSDGKLNIFPHVLVATKTQYPSDQVIKQVADDAGVSLEGLVRTPLSNCKENGK